MKHVPQKPTALGRPKSIGIVERASAGVARNLWFVFEKRHDITYRSESQPDKAAATCRVDQLIDLSSLKTRSEGDIVGIRLSIHLYKGPRIATDWSRGCIRVIADQQHGLCVMHIHSRMRQMMTVSEVKHGDAFISLKLTEHFSHQWLAVRTESLRGLQAHQARNRRDVGLPAAPHHRIAMAHQKAISWVERGRWVDGAWGTVEVCHHRLAPTVHDIKQQTTTPALGMEWLQHGEMGRKAYLACRIMGG